MAAGWRQFQGNHFNAAGREQLPGCQVGLGVALGVHLHPGDTAAAGVHEQLTQKRHAHPL